MLTGLSFVFGLLASYNLYYTNSMIAGLSYLISYYFDCLDGHYARKYNQVSKFGDYLDHISDISKHIVLIYVFYTLNPSKINYIIGIIFLLFILTSIHIGCQELNKHKHHNHEQPMLCLTERLCPDKDMIRYTRYFGPGTLTIVVFLIIIFYDKLCEFI